ADLRVAAADRVAGRAGRDDEVRDLAGLLAGDRGDRHERGDLGADVGDELLGPVDDPLVAVADGARAQRARVGATARLGQPEPGELLAARQRRQQLATLLLAAELVDR